MLNAIGLQNVGVDSFAAEKMPYLRKSGCHVIVNVFGFSMDEYVEVVRRLDPVEGIAAYELNVSCPNTERGGMVFGTDEAALGELVGRVRGVTPRPLFVKLSPNVTDIGTIARVAEASGADALTVANTYVAMAIDTDTFRPRLAHGTGGLSGPAIRPITLRLVWECARAVRIPIFGLGGIRSGEDAVEYFLAGATAVQVGTAHFHDPRASLRVLTELRGFLKRRGLGSVRDLIGKMEGFG
jgi:dihydroorotate dehydrogenase (NAD+) catalytic subunit